MKHLKYPQSASTLTQTAARKETSQQTINALYAQTLNTFEARIARGERLATLMTLLQEKADRTLAQASALLAKTYGEEGVSFRDLSPEMQDLQLSAIDALLSKARREFAGDTEDAANAEKIPQ